MQLRALRPHPPLHLGAASLLGLSLLGLPLGCESVDDNTRLYRPDAGVEPPPAAAADAGSEEPGLPPAATCPGSTPACAAGVDGACRASCSVGAEGCLTTRDFAPFSPAPEQYAVRVDAVDPDGQYVYLHYADPASARSVSPQRWSATDGVVALGDWLGLSAIAQPDDDAYVVRHVTRGERAVIGGIVQSDRVSTGFVWTPAAGATRLDFSPTAVSVDGSVVVGFVGRSAVVWSRAAGTRPLADDPLGERLFSTFVELSDSGAVALFDIGEGYPALWRGGAFDAYLTELLGVPPGPPIAAHLHPNGRAVFGVAPRETETFSTRAFVWTEATGAHFIDDVSGRFEHPLFSLELASADGRFFVGTMGSTTAGASAFRWSEETGMQPILEAADLVTPTFVSPSGDTVIGRYTRAGSTKSFRWTAAGGLHDIPATDREGIALDGDLLVTSGERGWTVSAYDRALQSDVSSAVSAALPALAPPGWSRAALLGVSNDARVLTGVAYDSFGTYRGWVLSLSDSCRR
ncbi:MAG TPA: hypothetical protein VMG12_04030 [Polyangiaceae bacterium]|nr:hypothetical protein [Polyangiaceae bacterium]